VKATERLIGLVESRGVAKAAWFVASRLLRYQDELLYAAEPAACGVPFVADAVTLVTVDAANIDRALPAPVHRQLFTGEGRSYHGGIGRGDLAFVLLDGSGALLHHSFVQFAVRTKRLLGEAEEVPLIAHCITVPAARGRQLYPRALRHVMHALASTGHRRVAINCDFDNHPSIHGIERAGFLRVARLRSLIVANRWCIQLRSPGGLRICAL
jgi:hypothetical protein